MWLNLVGEDGLPLTTDCIPVITLKRQMPDGKFPLIRVRLLNSYEGPILSATSLVPDLADSSPVSYAVTLAVPVSCCPSVPFGQLKGYLDLLTCDKAAELGSDLVRAVNRVLGLRVVRTGHPC